MTPSPDSAGRRSALHPNVDGRSPSGRYFLVGSLRSGTTLMRLLLEHHSQIARCHEFEFVLPAIAGRAEWPAVDAFVESLRCGEPYISWLYDRCVGRPDLDFPALADWLLCQLAEADGHRWVGAAVHHHIDQLPRLWPTARYIHLLRDPRDVARSCVEMGWAGNAWGAVPIWQRAHRSWQQLKELVEPERRIELRFEDLVRDPEHELRRITNFLGIEFEPTMLDIEKDTTYRRPNASEARTWRSESQYREVCDMELRLGQDLRDAGYEPSSSPSRPMSRLRVAHLALGDRWGRIRFDQRRYGTLLWFASVVSRRIPSNALRKTVRDRRWAITREHLK